MYVHENLELSMNEQNRMCGVINHQMQLSNLFSTPKKKLDNFLVSLLNFYIFYSLSRTQKRTMNRGSKIGVGKISRKTQRRRLLMTNGKSFISFCLRVFRSPQRTLPPTPLPLICAMSVELMEKQEMDFGPAKTNERIYRKKIFL
jgi:hypothetical protein